MQNEKCTKTIIKGLKEVTRYELTYKSDGEPELKLLNIKTESDENIDEIPYDLILTKSAHFLKTPYIIHVMLDDELQKVDIFNVIYKNNTKIIIIDKVIETEHQDYFEKEIKAQYQLEYDKYFGNYIKQFEDDKAKMALVNMYLRTMTKEEVIAILKNEKSNTTREYIESDKFILNYAETSLSKSQAEAYRALIASTFHIL